MRAIVAIRREQLIWRRTRLLDTPEAYWAYLRLYSQGPHAGDCYRRLAFLHASLEPPPDLSAITYDIPPPPPDESPFVQQSAIFFGDPTYGFAPPPPISEFLPPASPELAELPPPELPQTAFLLPTPVYVPVPVWIRPPRDLQPPNNVIFANLHNRVVTNRAANSFMPPTMRAARGRCRARRRLGTEIGNWAAPVHNVGSSPRSMATLALHCHLLSPSWQAVGTAP